VLSQMPRAGIMVRKIPVKSQATSLIGPKEKCSPRAAPSGEQPAAPAAASMASSRRK